MSSGGLGLILCGIAGFTHFRRSPNPERIWEITRSLIHRGPDQQGVWESSDVSLGAVRLKIIDLDHGDQPMVCERTGTVLAFNGEIYNHAELRRELEAKGHEFNSTCDTETALHAFLEWDIGAFSRMRGMFAAAFWNQSERRLVLGRDRVGIKPLYFSRQGTDIRFGSEMKAILLHPDVERQLDMEALDDYLSRNYVPGSRTLVEGIEKLPPGSWLEWQAGAVRIEKYWRMEMRPDPSYTVDSAKEELDDLLRSSVREHLLSDVPLGVWSSGGLDSSTILHYASEAGHGRLKTFSVSFQGREFDESPYFRLVSDAYGTEHHEFDLNPDADLSGVVEQLGYYADEPSADAGALPVWFLSEMCRKDVTVALSGDGADELFAGYCTYRADRYANQLRSLPLGLRRMAARAAKFLPVSNNKVGFDYKVNRLLQGSILDPAEAHFFWNGTFSREQQRELRNGAHVPDHDGPMPHCLNDLLAMDQREYLPDDILNKCDRMSMAHSLEVRPPFLDHRIVEFAARLPENMKIRGDKLKFVLRELMKDRLPQPLLARKKEGFDIPAHHWFRTALRPLLHDTVNERTVRESGFLAWPVVERVMYDHFERRANLGYHLWGLMILFLWMKRWGITAPSKVKVREEILTPVSVTI